jgi:3-phenylpropionate/cinnamic acid dioxygenase small subunit
MPVSPIAGAGVQMEKGAGVDLQALHDKIEIQELLARYARGVDSKDWALWKTVFTSDAHVDYRSAGAPAGPRDEIADWLARGLATLPMTQHFITNVEIELDGDRAKVRAMFYNPMQLPGVDGLSFCGGYYHHDVVRTPEGWKSQRMVEENLWFDNPPPTPPPPTTDDAVPRNSRPARR